MGSPLETLPSEELLRRLSVLVRRDRAAEAELLVHLGEVDARRLYLEQACSSMFQYCVRVLRFAECVAFKRIRVARAVRSHPELLDAIRCGDVHVTAASLLVPQLTRENARDLLREAKHKTAEEVRELLADRRPRPDVAASVRPVREGPAVRASEPLVSGLSSEARRPPSDVSAPTSHPAPALATARPEPLGHERYCVRFTAAPETWARLKELRALMRHQIPDGDVGKILSRAIAVLLAQVRKQKLGACSQPKSASERRSNDTEGARPTPSRAIPTATSVSRSCS